MTQQQASLWQQPADVTRRKSHGSRLLNLLWDRFTVGDVLPWVERNELEQAIGTHNFTARISELRRAGYVIENKREGLRSFYRCTGKSDAPTTKQGAHCPTCRCA